MKQFIYNKNQCLLRNLLFPALFLSGMGPMPWTINSEIYPLWARSTGNACAAGVNWTFNILVSLTFLHLAQYFTYYGWWTLLSEPVSLSPSVTPDLIHFSWLWRDASPFSGACVTFIPQHTSKRDKDVMATLRLCRAISFNNARLFLSSRSLPQTGRKWHFSEAGNQSVRGNCGAILRYSGIMIDLSCSSGLG